MTDPRRPSLILVLEAALWLILAAAAVRLVAFRTLGRFASGPVGGADQADPVRIRRAVEAAARRAPWRTACFERGLAAQAMLRRRGQAAVLHYGARGDGDRGPSAHVWVTLKGQGVIGMEEAERFAELARYPADAD